MVFSAEESKKMVKLLVDYISFRLDWLEQDTRLVSTGCVF